MTVNLHIFPIRCGFFFFLHTFNSSIYFLLHFGYEEERESTHRPCTVHGYWRRTDGGYCWYLRSSGSISNASTCAFRGEWLSCYSKWNDTVCMRLPKRNSYTIACNIPNEIHCGMATRTTIEQQQKRAPFVGRQWWLAAHVLVQFFARPINSWSARWTKKVGEWGWVFLLLSL